MKYMTGRRVLFGLLIITFLVAVALTGIYLFNTLIPKQNPTASPTPSIQIPPSDKITNVKNGGSSDYPQSVGGIDDYNSGGTIPADSYHSVWTTCNTDNNYCNTYDKFAKKMDGNTGLIWSANIGNGVNWFVANNCKYPNGLLGSGATCDSNGELACKCVKHTGDPSDPNDLKTGCEALNGGSWRLPYQKELMQAYIDGSLSNLSDAHDSYWSATTRSDETQSAWETYLSYGNTSRDGKILENSVRCVR
jgi:hypothetical protein